MLSLLYKFCKNIMDPIKQMIHELNREAHGVNKNLIQKTHTLGNVPLTDIYSPQNQAPRPNSQVPVPTNPQVPVSSPQIAPVSQPTPQVESMSSESTEKLIKQLVSVEKKIDRFFNLIEKRVVKNAKEINIRIKLNDDISNERTSTEQE